MFNTTCNMLVLTITKTKAKQNTSVKLSKNVFIICNSETEWVHSGHTWAGEAAEEVEAVSI